VRPELLSNPTFVPFEQSYTLSKNVPAIQIVSTDSEQRSRLGLITQLPEGMKVDVGGPGFNDSTVKIRCGGASYYVFLDDLEPQRKHVASAAASS
jgi:hypothetical protein